MKITSKTKIVKIKNPCIYAGEFGILYQSTDWYYDSDQVSWHDCRETFSEDQYVRQWGEFFFSHKLDNYKNIVDFFNKIENRLGLRREGKLRFIPTNSAYNTLVIPSDWWRANSLRTQFLTIALRAADKGSPLTYLKSLEVAHYFKTSKPALKYFLNGYTICDVIDGENTYDYGWNSTFNRRTAKQVKKIMKKELTNSKKSVKL